VKRKVLITFLVFSLFYVWQCKRKTSEESELKRIITSDKNIIPSGKNNLSLSSEEAIKYPAIKKIEIIPENPVPGDIIKITVDYDAGGMKDLSKYYIFYKNGKKIGEGSQNVFTLEKFKKNDFFSCEIVFFEGTVEVKKVKSPYIKILGRPPKIDKIILPKKINKPGNFKIRIIASDPDNDKLTFEIVNKKDLGNIVNIEKINPNEAIINLNLAKDSFNKRYIIKLMVKDDESSIVQTIMLDLKSKIIKTKEKKKEETGKQKNKINKKEVEGVSIGLPIKIGGIKCPKF